MKKTIKYPVITLLLICTAFIGCKRDEGTYLTLNVVEKTLSPKDTFQFVLKTQGLESANGGKINWTLENAIPKVTGTEVATISSDGLLRAANPGTVTVKASIGGRYALAQVDVVPRDPAAISDLSFSKDVHYMSIEGIIPDTAFLTVKANLLNLYDLKLSSSNTEIVRIELFPDNNDHKGELTVTKKILMYRGGKEGTAVISADAGGTTVSMSVRVGVKTYLSFSPINTALGMPALTISNPYTFYVNSRDTINIYYYASPDDQVHLDQMKLSVTSSGDGVLSVVDFKRNSNNTYSIIVQAGKLKGNQKLTITMDDNVLTSDIQIMDRNDVNVTSVSFLPNYKNITTTDKGVALGENVKVLPLSAIEHWPLVWSSSNKAIATVNTTGDVVIHRPGVVSITATSKDKFDVSVITAKLKIESIAFASNLVNTLAESETTTWTANITANYDASSVTKTWTSSNSNVATVNATTGQITAVAPGTAEITVSVTDDFGLQKSAKKLITVTSVNIFPLDFNSGTYNYVSDVASNGSLTGISIDVFNPDFTKNYSFKLYKANSSVNFNLSGTATYTVGVEINIVSIINYLDIAESAVLLPGSKLIVNNGVITFDMSAKRGIKTVTIKGTVNE